MSAGIIAVSGFAGSGKNTVGAEVARSLGWRIVAPTFKDLASRDGISLMEFQEKAEKDLAIDYKFDAELARQVGNGNCAVVTWIGPWIKKISGKKYAGIMIPPVLPDVFSVWLDVDESTRAKRVAGRDGISKEDAFFHIKKRDSGNVKRYKRAYGIDIMDHSGFDLVVKVSDERPEEVAKKILAKFKME